MSNLGDYQTTVINVFVNGVHVSSDLWKLGENGEIEFTKPLAEIDPQASTDPVTGKPVFWIIFEYESK